MAPRRVVSTNGKIKVTIIDVDNNEKMKELASGTKASSLIKKDQVATVTPAGDGQVILIQPGASTDLVLRDGDTVQIHRKPGKPG
jgi:hypothetical protein